MIIKIASLKELPYRLYTAHLLKSESDITDNMEGYLITTSKPKMTILFTEYIEEIYGKTNKNKEISV